MNLSGLSASQSISCIVSVQIRPNEMDDYLYKKVQGARSLKLVKIDSKMLIVSFCIVMRY
mgnify:CR=1 FL=1